MEGKYDVSIEHYPVHNYYFDLISLNFTFRHLINPEVDFEVGITCPEFTLFGFGKEKYIGKTLIKYIDEENIHNTLCRKYMITGNGIKNRKGFIWVNKDLGYIIYPLLLTH